MYMYMCVTLCAGKAGSIDFKMRTVEPHGLLLFNGGRPGGADFFAVEMYDGILYAVLNLGDGVSVVY